MKNRFIELRSFITNNIKKARKLGFFHLLTANVLMQILGFGMQMFLAKLMVAEDLGRIRVLQSFVNIALVVSTIGMEVSITKFCSEKIENDKKIGMLSTAIKSVLLSSLIIYLLLFILSFFGFYSKDDLVNTYMRYYAIILPIISLSNLLFAYLQSQKQVKKIAKVQSFSRILNICVVVLFVYFFNFKGYIISMIVCAFLSFCLYVPQLKSELKQSLNMKINKYYFSKLFEMGKYNLLTNAMGQLMASMDSLMINYFTNNQKELGYYSIAQMFILGLRMIPNTLAQIMIPYISEETDNIEKITCITKAYKKKLAYVMSVVILLSYFIIPLLVRFFFGYKYNNTIVYFRVLIVGLAAFSLYVPNITILLSIGQVKYNLYYGILMGVSSLFFSYIFIQKYDVIGVAYASSLTFIVGLFISEFLIRRVFKRLYSEKNN